VTNLVVGVTRSDGSIVAIPYANTTRESIVELNAGLNATADDHANPSFLIRASDNRVLAFYTGHNVTGTYMRVSTNPLDVSSWGSEVNLDSQLGIDYYSYTNPIQLTGEANDPIYLFMRAAPEDSTDWAGYVSTSEDDGATWGTAINWLLGTGANRPYWRFIENGDSRIDIVLTDGHPNNVSTNSIYHGYLTGGSLYQSDGTLIGALASGPYAPTDFTLVYDGTTTRAWCWDIAIEADGQPRILFATFPTAATDHRYRWAIWNGSAWADYEVCTAGGRLYAAESYYSGGVCFDYSDPNTVYASRQVMGDWQIYKEVTANDGVSWTETQITTDDAHCIRPVIIRGGTKLAYLRGYYRAYTDFDTQIILASV